jgi:hypothetical protein
VPFKEKEGWCHLVFSPAGPPSDAWIARDTVVTVLMISILIVDVRSDVLIPTCISPDSFSGGLAERKGWGQRGPCGEPGLRTRGYTQVDVIFS